MIRIGSLHSFSILMIPFAIMLFIRSGVGVPTAAAQEPARASVVVAAVESGELLTVVFEGREQPLRLIGVQVPWCMADEGRLRVDGLARGRVAVLQLGETSQDGLGRL